MLRAAALSLILLAAGLAGCSDPLSFGSTGDVDGFSVTPDRGDGKTEFHVQAADELRGRDLTWTFGDGTEAKGDEARHAYGFTNGVMTITLIARDESGVPQIATRTVTLGTGENKPPTGTARAVKDWVAVGQPANLSANARDADGDTLTYLWSYTDASAAGSAAQVVIEGSGPRTSVVFDAPGRYDVKVRIRDPKGAEAIDNLTIDVSRTIPESRIETTFKGTLVAGTGGAAVAEKAWVEPAPDSYADAARHPYTLDYPATTYVVLQWNDTSNASAYDLDFEVRDAQTGEVVATGAHHAVDPNAPGAPTPLPPIEANFTTQEAGSYVIVVKAFSGARVDYEVFLFSTLHLTAELVAAREG